MAAGASFTHRYGLAVRRASVATAGLLAIDVLLSRSSLRRVLKSCAGRSRNCAAILARGRNLAPTLGSRPGTVARGRAISASTTLSSCSLRLWLAIRSTRLTCQFTGRFLCRRSDELISQSLQPAKLQLFYGTAGAAEFFSDFADAFLLCEAHFDHAALSVRKRGHEPEKFGALLDIFHVDVVRQKLVGGRVALLPRFEFPAVCYGV